MILVTGATGTSGPEIVKALLDRGQRVRVLARNPEKAAQKLGDEVEIARGDLADQQSIEAAMEDVERALLSSAPSPDQVTLQSNFIKAAKNAGVRHVVKFSAASADARADRVVAKWHGMTEEELKRSGLAWTMLRPSFFMQNLLGIAAMVKQGTIYMPTGNGKGGFIDVRDVAAVAAATLTEPGHEGKVYELSGPQALSYSDIAAIFTTVLGREVKYVNVPLEVARQNMVQAGMPEWAADAVNELSQGMAEGKFQQINDNVRTIGNKQPITVQQFIQENRAEFM